VAGAVAAAFVNKNKLPDISFSGILFETGE
jgi:hypothetical protein